MIANKMRCGLTLKTFSFVVPYILGISGASVFVMVRDGCTYQILFPIEYGSLLPLMFTEATYSDMLMITTAVLLVFPSVYLIYYHLRHNLQANTLMILLSTLVLGGSYIIGEVFDLYWLFYAVAFLLSVFWLSLGYEDIQSVKKQAEELKQELNDILLVNPKVIPTQDRRVANHQSLETPLQDEDFEQLYHTNTGDTVGLTKADSNQPTIKNRELVDKAISYIKANFNKEIELAAIAHYTKVSDSYLIRTFKKVTGKTINQYITCYRLQRAQQLLKNHSVVETSHAVGFKNASYFSTVFKKHTGLSPLHYQQKLH
ncbi:helix-turn-helix transcriptional regulator [Paraglaciecola sp. L3A3]|uniref:helix-turn-helix transcriptional regulator n=1 Tax=Paraglaciecola sp. L3A3 TaxID=2686358 RepID=UPI00131B7B5F|nr:AraC family transcriptional regulator [Paraglaciecola sp. L3A3]